ncbi:MAG TPA: type VI secretion system protein TssA [Methylomirabilota bacterium]|nr:type VI secretion system protein TssA [Methylomirabilota bacterium]
MAIAFEELLAPIAGDNPSGADVSFEQIYEDIKEARRQDDPTLSQGDWKAELKVASWPKARDLCIEVLSQRSKDLQVAAWLTEALGQLYGFAGLGDGFALIEKLLADFWDTLYPEADGGDLDLRAARIAWINRNLPLQIRFIPVTAEGKFGWVKWQESRDVDNLARQSAEAAQTALDEGKINGEIFARAVANTPGAFYQELLEQLGACKTALDALIARIDERFGNDAPSLMDARSAVEDCLKLATRIATDKGLLTADEAPAAEGGEEAAAADGTPGAAVASRGASGPIASRADALRRLAEVAEYFRRAEPHSPVAYLADRAMRWGNMTLDQWLQEMVKDPNMLAGLRESLGIKSEAPPE